MLQPGRKIAYAEAVSISTHMMWNGKSSYWLQLIDSATKEPYAWFNIRKIAYAEAVTDQEEPPV
jgi:uncharacterized protein (DUF427 family)